MRLKKSYTPLVGRTHYRAHHDGVNQSTQSETAGNLQGVYRDQPVPFKTELVRPAAGIDHDNARFAQPVLGQDLTGQAGIEDAEKVGGSHVGPEADGLPVDPYLGNHRGSPLFRAEGGEGLYPVTRLE
jgi:hypothetical protein